MPNWTNRAICWAIVLKFRSKRHPAAIEHNKKLFLSLMSPNTVKCTWHRSRWFFRFPNNSWPKDTHWRVLKLLDIPMAEGCLCHLGFMELSSSVRVTKDGCPFFMCPCNYMFGHSSSWKLDSRDCKDIFRGRASFWFFVNGFRGLLAELNLSGFWEICLKLCMKDCLKCK